MLTEESPDKEMLTAESAQAKSQQKNHYRITTKGESQNG